MILFIHRVYNNNTKRYFTQTDKAGIQKQVKWPNYVSVENSRTCHIRALSLPYAFSRDISRGKKKTLTTPSICWNIWFVIGVMDGVSVKESLMCFYPTEVEKMNVGWFKWSQACEPRNYPVLPQWIVVKTWKRQTVQMVVEVWAFMHSHHVNTQPDNTINRPNKRSSEDWIMGTIQNPQWENHKTY